MSAAAVGVDCCCRGNSRVPLLLLPPPPLTRVGPVLVGLWDATDDAADDDEMKSDTSNCTC